MRKKLFSILKRMREQGNAIIIITHKLNEVLEISDRVTILRKGKSIDIFHHFFGQKTGIL